MGALKYASKEYPHEQYNLMLGYVIRDGTGRTAQYNTTTIRYLFTYNVRSYKCSQVCGL